MEPTQTNAITRRTNNVLPPQALQPINTDTTDKLKNATTSAVEAFNAPQDEGGVLAALQVASAVEELRQLFDLPEIKSRILSLQDKAIGFRTDKDPTRKQKGRDGQPDYFPTPYSWDVVKDCAIEATLRGLQLVGNQMNILAGRMYCTKEGYEYLIRKLKNVTDFAQTLHVPRAAGAGNGVLIECEATWLQDGKDQSIKATIPVKTDNYSTIEQSMGKATRKFLKRCYERMTGNSISDGDAGEALEVEVSPEEPKQTPKAPSFSKTTKQAAPAPEPDPTPAPETATDPTQQLTELQSQFATFCADSNVSFEDAMGWLRTTARWKESANADGFGDVPDEVIQQLLKAPNDIKKLVTLYGRVVAK